MCWVVTQCTKGWARTEEMKASQRKRIFARSWLGAHQEEGEAVHGGKQNAPGSGCWWQAIAWELVDKNNAGEIWEPDYHGLLLLCQGVHSLSFVSGKSPWSFKYRGGQMWVLECSGSSEEIWMRDTGGRQARVWEYSQTKGKRQWGDPKGIGSFFPWHSYNFQDRIGCTAVTTSSRVSGA